MSQVEQWTVGRLLEWTTDFLKKSGAESPRLDAEVLLASARGCERIALYMAFTEEVSEEVRAKFRGLVKQRASGVPVAYLVGQREFYSLPLKVTPAVLIPRPETEFLVIAALDEIKSRYPSGTSPQIVDVGTGSGAVALAIAKHAPHAKVTAIDISPEALAVAKENAESLGLAGQIRFVQGDLLASIPAKPELAIVVSNPPYIGEGEMAGLASQVKDQEPRLALVGGPQGNEIIARLIPQAAERLIPGGLLAMEFSPIIADSVVALLQNDGRFEQIQVTKDLAGLARIVSARKQQA